MLEFLKIYNVTDNLHGTVHISQIERDIIATPIFTRLHKILQNSLVYLTFPSNKTKRYEHSLGVMHLTGEVFSHSIANATNSDITIFFDNINDAILNWFNSGEYDKEKSFLGDDATKPKVGLIIKHREKIHNIDNSLYNNVVPGNLAVEYKFEYLVVYQALRIAALLHDVGHLPYSHVVEAAIKKLYYYCESQINIEDKAGRFGSFIETIQPHINEFQLHEAIGVELAKSIRAETRAQYTTKGTWNKASENEKYNLLIMYISFDIALKILKASKESDGVFYDLHSIISSTIDADRFDFCCRDTLACGIRTGTIDYERVLNSFSLIHEEIPSSESGVPARKRAYFCMASKNYKSAEDLLYRRWRIYTDVIFHHKVHKYEVLMTDCLFTLGKKFLDCTDDAVENDDYSAFLDLEIDGLWTTIDELISNKAPGLLEQKIIQYDDSWLDVLLKKEYILTSYPKISSGSSEISQSDLELQELISGKEMFFSIIKREHDFLAISDATISELRSNGKLDKVHELINYLLSSNTAKTNPKYYKEFFDAFSSVHDELQSARCVASKKGAIEKRKLDLFDSILSLLTWDADGMVVFTNSLEQMLKTQLPEADTAIEYVLFDYIKVRLKDGLDSNDPVIIWKTADDNSNFHSSLKLSEVSTIANKISQERRYFPYFYVYVSKKDATKRIDIQKDLKVIGKAVADSFVYTITNYLEGCKS